MVRGATVNSHLVRLGDGPPPLNSISFEGPDARRRTPPGSMIDRLEKIEKLSIICNHLPTSVFDQGSGPATLIAGIYRCVGCHREMGTASGHALPPRGYPTHTPVQESIRCRLVV